MLNSYTPTVLTIAGSDPYGGAGVQADLKTIHANGGYALTVTTALTAQNSRGVMSVNVVDASIVQAQLEALLCDIEIDALKIGMLGSREIGEVVIATIKKYQLKNIVLDTVIVSSSGKRLLDDLAMDIFKKELIPLADLITPNLLEINSLTDRNFSGTKEEIEPMRDALLNLHIQSALIKGGHFQNRQESIDILIQKDYPNRVFSSKRIETTHTHGTGCTLSSAIATYLARGESLSKSIELGKAYLLYSMQNSTTLNFNYKENNLKRSESINHLVKLKL